MTTRHQITMCAAAIVAMLASAQGHAADGTVSISWGTCTPVVSDIPSTTNPMSIVVSVLGNDQAHNAYQVRFLLGSDDDTVPDAWRFDFAGCQGVSQAFVIRHLPPASLAKTCPAFQGTNPSIQIRDYSFYSGSYYPNTLMRGTLANTYPAGTTANPAQRYFLAEFLFDHLYSVNGPGTPGVTCGGLETTIHVNLLTGDGVDGSGSTTYLRMIDGWEIPFTPSGFTSLTVNGSVPAVSTTWGQVKSAYRR